VLASLSRGCTGGALGCSLIPLASGVAASVLCLALSAIDRSDGFFWRSDLSEGRGDDLSGLSVVDEIVEGGNQLLLREVVQVGGVLGELELRLLVLYLGDELDGIQVDTLTSIGGQCSFERPGDLLAEVVANVLRQLDGDALLAAWPTLTSARTTQPALVDHLEGSDLRVAVVLLIGRQLGACTQGMKLL
jgi:hypothetical protein